MRWLGNSNNCSCESLMIMEPAVDLLRREYIQLLEPDKVTIPAPNLIRVPHVQRQIFQSIFQEGSLAFPPPDRYKLRVLKKLIESMERAIKDPEEDVWSPICSKTCLWRFQTHISLTPRKFSLTLD